MCLKTFLTVMHQYFMGAIACIYSTTQAALCRSISAGSMLVHVGSSVGRLAFVLCFLEYTSAHQV